LAISFFGLALYILGLAQRIHLNQNDYASLLTFSVIIFWVGGFVFLYGRRAFSIAYFPVVILIFMVPIPSWVLSKVIYALQVGSTEASEILFTLTGVPFQRDGFVFHLPGISVQVAEVCSGIRSTLALFITSILAGHFFLDRRWKSAALALFVFPVTVFKNGLRIVTLSLLGAYVDPRFLTGSFLHQSGGFLFFLPALGLLGLALWWLRRMGNGAPFKNRIEDRGSRREKKFED
jgi:exosortase